MALRDIPPGSRPAARKKPGETRTLRERCVALCERVAEGSSMSKACLAEGVARGSFSRLIRPGDGCDEELLALYRQALVEKAQTRIDGLIDEADAVIKAVKKGAPPALVSAFSVKANIMKWIAEKEGAPVYGARLDLNHGGVLKIVADKSDLGLL